MLEKVRARMFYDGIAADDRYTVQQDRTSLLMLTTIAARSARGLLRTTYRLTKNSRSVSPQCPRAKLLDTIASRLNSTNASPLVKRNCLLSSVRSGQRNTCLLTW
eukprot:COSAG05_NODE_763_length_7481_cov_10.717150_4_plen_105_part_00